MHILAWKRPHHILIITRGHTIIAMRHHLGLCHRQCLVCPPRPCPMRTFTDQQTVMVEAVLTVVGGVEAVEVIDDAVTIL